MPPRTPALFCAALLAFAVSITGAGCGRTPFSIGAADGEAEDDGGNTGGAGAGSTTGTGAGGGVGGAGGVGGGDGGAIIIIPEGCERDTDCADGDFCTDEFCDDGSCAFVVKDSDQDGFADALCVGAAGDCNDLNPNSFPGAVEDCTDGDDNDCNAVADCFDPACSATPECGCTPSPLGEICGNGEDDDCDTSVDCNDADCIGTAACGCEPDEVGRCGDGIDNDCDGRLDCDDADCGISALCQCQATPEQCSNDGDDDCDLLVDCADPDCFGAQACTCVEPGSPEVCNDNFDNDCDGDVDCADGDCAASQFCQNCVPEVCDDGIDNDCDDVIDCADDACFFAPNCAPTPEQCNNDLDDDNDGDTDCDDLDCVNNPACAESQSNCITARFIPGTGTYTGDTTGNINNVSGACGGGAGEAVFFFTLTRPSFVRLDTVGTSFDSVLHVRYGDCEIGAEIACDDDSGGFQFSAAIEFPILYPGTYFVFVDGFTVDPNFGANEGPYTLNVVINPDPPEVCGDGVDNDGDVVVDCADPDCINDPACFNCNGGSPPTAEFGVAACTDGVDNDCDGVTDCADEDCSASPYALTECCTGTDQNGNNIADDFACRCRDDADCGGGQICYTATVRTCGLPCQNFFGNVCPAVAQGSSCNLATSQCQF